MNKKILFIIFAILIICGVAAITIYRPSKSIQGDYIDKLDVQNSTYIIEGKYITLKNGYNEQEIAPGSASKLITRYFGNKVSADFNDGGMGNLDSAFLLSQDGGGSGTFYYIAALVSEGDKYIGTNAILLGDRIAPQTTEFKDGGIVVNYADRRPGEPFSVQPSIGVSRYFRIYGRELREIKLIQN